MTQAAYDATADFVVPEHLAGVPRLLTTGELARELSCSTTNVHLYIAGGLLRPAFYTLRTKVCDGMAKVNDYLFTPEERDRFLAARASVSLAAARRFRSKRRPAQLLLRLFNEYSGGRA